MNYLVFLDARAGELEKILSGMKTMLVKECDPLQGPAHPVNPGDQLYFLRDQQDGAVRVRATVTRTLFFTRELEGHLGSVLKEMQPRLQFTEDQFYFWSEKEQALLVEFEAAQKIDAIRVGAQRAGGRPGWVAFETIDQIV